MKYREKVLKRFDELIEELAEEQPGPEFFSVSIRVEFLLEKSFGQGNSYLRRMETYYNRRIRNNMEMAIKASNKYPVYLTHLLHSAREDFSYWNEE